MAFIAMLSFGCGNSNKKPEQIIRVEDMPGPKHKQSLCEELLIGSAHVKKELKDILPKLTSKGRIEFCKLHIAQVKKIKTHDCDDLSKNYAEYAKDLQSAKDFIKDNP